MNTFEEILQNLLSAVQSNPNISVEEVLKKAAADLELSPDEMMELEDAFRTLDVINDKSRKLQEARTEGKTRTEWFKEELSDIANSCEPQAENIILEIEKGIETGLNNTLTQEN